MPTEIIQTNLPQFNDPVILPTFKPRVQKRPGTIGEWTEFVSRLAALSEDLYRDARVMFSKRREAAEARQGSPSQQAAQRDFEAVLKRASEHSQNLANAFLATGMPREHLENHLKLCGTEHDRVPDYDIALLYCKIMGIPFREERVSPVVNAEGETSMERIVEQRTFTWVKVLKQNEIEDFYRTTKKFNETIPPLAAKFRRGEVRM